MLRDGIWTLPVYMGPMKIGVATGKQKKPGLAPGISLVIRTGMPGESVFRSRALPYINLDEAPVPIEHDGAASHILRANGPKT